MQFENKGDTKHPGPHGTHGCMAGRVCVCVYCVCKRTRVCLVLGALQRLEFTLHESVKTKTESGDRKGKDTDGGMNTAG